jgi:hypothetical protein
MRYIKTYEEKNKIEEISIIKIFSPDKEKLEAYINAKKYNL